MQPSPSCWTGICRSRCKEWSVGSSAVLVKGDDVAFPEGATFRQVLYIANVALSGYAYHTCYGVPAENFSLITAAKGAAGDTGQGDVYDATNAAPSP